MSNKNIEDFKKTLNEWKFFINENQEEYRSERNNNVGEFPIDKDLQKSMMEEFKDTDVYHVNSIPAKGAAVKRLVKLALALSLSFIPGATINKAVKADELNIPSNQAVNRSTAKELIQFANTQQQQQENASEANTQEHVPTFNLNTQPMNYQEVRDRLKEHEGQENKPYYDSEGYLTIGIGTLITKSHRNTSMSGQIVQDEEEIQYALMKLSSQFGSIYSYTQGDTQINNSQAESLLDSKFNYIHGLFVDRVDHYAFLPKALKEVLADMYYNMGHNFFSGSSFIQHIKRLAVLLKKDSEENLSEEEIEEVKSLITFRIPREFADSDYFDTLTSHDSDPSAAGRPVITDAEGFNYLLNTYEGRPVNLLNVYKEVVDAINVMEEESIVESYSLKKVYSHLFFI